MRGFLWGTLVLAVAYALLSSRYSGGRQGTPGATAIDQAGTWLHDTITRLSDAASGAIPDVGRS